MNNILYIGSGKSVNYINHIDLSEYLVVGVNNTWQLFAENKQRMDVWIHTGDYVGKKPDKNHVNIGRIVSYEEYSQAVLNIAKKLAWDTTTPWFYAGYTIFFQGLYWVMDELQPKKISLLGFDHDYNPQKVDKWIANNCPAPNNKYNNTVHSNKDVDEWCNAFFTDMEPDAFYGHGTPDPLRLDKELIRQKFEVAKKSAYDLHINLVNISPIETDINTIQKEPMIFGEMN